MNIIITGTSRGIGLELAKLFAEANHQVLCLSRKNNPALTQNQNISYLSVDLSHPSDLQLVEDFISNTWKK